MGVLYNSSIGVCWIWNSMELLFLVCKCSFDFVCEVRLQYPIFLLMIQIGPVVLAMRNSAYRRQSQE
jgi:hypothetical protein